MTKEVIKREAEFNKVQKANKREEEKQKKMEAEEKAVAGRDEQDIGGELIDVDRPLRRHFQGKELETEIAETIKRDPTLPSARRHRP